MGPQHGLGQIHLASLSSRTHPLPLFVELLPEATRGKHLDRQSIGYVEQIPIAGDQEVDEPFNRLCENLQVIRISYRDVDCGSRRNHGGFVAEEGVGLDH